MEYFWQDLRHGVRVLRKSPGFSAVAILSLALGIGANTTIFTVVNAILLHPLPVKDISQVVELDTIDTKTHVGFANATKLGLSFRNFQDYQKQNEVLSGVACILPVPLTWSGGAEARQVNGTMVSANYFDVLGLQSAAGRFFLPDEDTKLSGNNVAVISYSFWANKLGADLNEVGKTLTLNAMPYTVIGVAPKGFKGTFTFGSAEQIWVPTSMHSQILTGFAEEFFNDRRLLNALAVGRLKSGIGVNQAEASLKTIASQLEKDFPKDNGGRSIALTPLTEAAVGANQHDQIALASTMMMTVVGLVLLIACANLANLLLARAARREREMGLRAALGASRPRLIHQMLTECILLSLIGGAAGLAIAYAGRTILWSFRPPFIQADSIDLSLDANVLIFTLGISLLTGLLFGVAPAFKASVPDLADTLKLGGRGGSIGWGRNKLRSLLVVSEIALSLVALVAAGLFIRSMRDAQKMDPGFESKNLFMLAFDLGALHYDEGHGQQFLRAAVERANATPGVKAAAIASNFPLGGGFARTVFPEGEDESTGYRGTLTQLDDITAGYFDALRIPLLRGRLFTDADRKETASVAIINEAMAKKFWPDKDAIGKRFHFFGDTTLREVVGIARNSVVNAIGEVPVPLVYLPLAQDYAPAATLQVQTTGKPEPVIAGVRAQIQSLEPNLAITNVQTIGEIIDQGLWAPEMGAALLTVFGGLAMVLAALGVYGVLAYAVTQQTREIGIRMAMGAEGRDVLGLVVGQGLKLAGAGVALGILVALGLTRQLSSLLFGVSAYDPLTYGGVTLILVIVALLACYLPARRVTRVDPLVALRYE
jgi:putative ABC transport system permease protein